MPTLSINLDVAAPTGTLDDIVLNGETSVALAALARCWKMDMAATLRRVIAERAQQEAAGSTLLTPPSGAACEATMPPLAPQEALARLYERDGLDALTAEQWNADLREWRVDCGERWETQEKSWRSSTSTRII